MLAAILTNIIVFSCHNPIIDNWTKVWNEEDAKTLKQAQIRCGEIYPDAPCVKLFRKKEELNYNVICGAKQRND